MQEHEPAYDPEILLRLKDVIQSEFQKLPPEHQATMGLVLVGEIMNGEWGAWFTDAFVTRYSIDREPMTDPLVVKPISPDELRGMSIAEEDIRALSPDDLPLITHRVQEHLALDVFDDEVRFAIEQILENKQKK